MRNKDCELCSFENPKVTATAIAIKDGALLVVKRNEEPFRGQWDFIGGFVQKNETVEDCLRREISEELGVKSSLTYLGQFTGNSFQGKYDFPVLTFVYLIELKGRIKLNQELAAMKWVPLSRLKTIAFNSNQKILRYLKKKFVYKLERVKRLIYELDPSAEFNETSFYKALLGGYVSQVYQEGRLIGFGWVFIRQTMLRKQAVIEDMIVDQNYRGRGLGKRILQNLINWSRDQGVEVIELTTNPRRLAANKLYQKFGFRLRETNYYSMKLY